MGRNGIIGLIVAIVAALFGGRAVQRRRSAGSSGADGGLGGLIGGIGGQTPGSGDLGGLLGGLGEEPSGGTGKLRNTEGKPVQEV